MPQTPHWRRRKNFSMLTPRQKMLYHAKHALDVAGRVALPKTRGGRIASWVGIPAAAGALTGFVSVPMRNVQTEQRVAAKYRQMKAAARTEVQPKISELQRELDSLAISKLGHSYFKPELDAKVETLLHSLKSRLGELGYETDRILLDLNSSRIVISHEPIRKLGLKEEISGPWEKNRIEFELGKVLHDEEQRLGILKAKQQAEIEEKKFNAEKDKELAELSRQMRALTVQADKKSDMQVRELIAQQPHILALPARDAAVASGVSGAIIGSAAAIVAAKRLLYGLREKRRVAIENERLRKAFEISRSGQAHNNQMAMQPAEGRIPELPHASTPQNSKKPTPRPAVAEVDRLTAIRKLAENSGMRGSADLGSFARFFRNTTFSTQGQMQEMVTNYLRVLNRTSADFHGLNIPHELMGRHALETVAGNTERAASLMERIRMVAEARKQSARLSGLPINPKLTGNMNLFSRLKNSNPELHRQLLLPNSPVNEVIFSVVDSLRRSYPERFILSNRQEISVGVVKMLLGLAKLHTKGNVRHETAVKFAGADKNIKGPMADSIYCLKSLGVIRVYESREKHASETIQLNWPQNLITRLFVQSQPRNNH